MKNPSICALSVDLPFEWIQAIRIAQALMESAYKVHIPEKHATKFSHLEKVFKLDYDVGVEDAPVLSGVEICHRIPLTRIGSIKRPLIFAHAIFAYCRRLWFSERDVQVSFAGLLTQKRHSALRSWFAESFPETHFDQVLREGVPHVPENLDNVIVLWSSNRGREFPVKAWDEHYFRLLARSKFVLCPKGDFIWTYRFFESAMCGAIPIIEAYCPAYEGFYFHSMRDQIDSLRWSPNAAEHNFELCLKRLTVPLDRLNREIASMLGVDALT